ncbi:MAG: class I SAM-dependent methyltransferase [Bacteroidota bacterium]
MIIEELPTHKGYNLWAKHYESNGNPMTGLDGMVFEKNFPFQDIKNKKVLDIGCGTGRLTRILSQNGGIVSGIDISEQMLKIARKNDPKSNYQIYIANRAFPFKDDSFDFITSNLVLEHVEDLLFFFGEIVRISKKTSVIYISAMHPAMLLKGTQANFKDPESGKEFRPKGYPHQIADFVQNMNTSGLLIKKMNEYKGTEELIAQFSKAEKYKNWPMLVTFELKKM